MKITSIAVLAAFAFAALLPTLSPADEPANPIKGAVKKLYNFYFTSSVPKHDAEFRTAAREIVNGEKVAYSTSVDTGSDFSVSGDVEFGMWHGFLKRKTGGVYTFTLNPTRSYFGKYPHFSLWVNGQEVVTASAQLTAVNVTLNPGFNEVCFVSECSSKYYVQLSMKKKDSLKEATIIGPGDLWHEDEPDDDDDEE